jgi:hypothetical protein
MTVVRLWFVANVPGQRTIAIADDLATLFASNNCPAMGENSRPSSAAQYWVES